MRFNHLELNAQFARIGKRERTQIIDKVFKARRLFRPNRLQRCSFQMLMLNLTELTTAFYVSWSCLLPNPYAD